MKRMKKRFRKIKNNPLDFIDPDMRLFILLFGADLLRKHMFFTEQIKKHATVIEQVKEAQTKCLESSNPK
jgi:hypothetical protein